MSTAGPTPRFESKICAPSELADRAQTLQGPVAFTNGVFDLLHRGHVTYLDQAAQQGASLIVALNSDESVRRLGKGDDRPINTLQDRMAVMASLGCTSLVTWFEQDTPLEAILAARPSVLVKGGDWAVENMVGAPEVQSWGGRAVSIAFEHQRSTTQMLHRIRGTQPSS